MVKILITTQVNLVPILLKFGEGLTNLPKSSALKFLPLNYYHSHFLAATFDFCHPDILGLHTFFTAWLFLYRYLLLNNNCCWVSTVQKTEFTGKMCHKKPG